MVQWVKNLTTAAWVALEVQMWLRSLIAVAMGIGRQLQLQFDP